MVSGQNSFGPHQYTAELWLVGGFKDIKLVHKADIVLFGDGKLIVFDHMTVFPRMANEFGPE